MFLDSWFQYEYFGSVEESIFCPKIYTTWASLEKDKKVLFLCIFTIVTIFPLKIGAEGFCTVCKTPGSTPFDYSIIQHCFQKMWKMMEIPKCRRVSKNGQNRRGYHLSLIE